MPILIFTYSCSFTCDLDYLLLLSPCMFSSDDTSRSSERLLSLEKKKRISETKFIHVSVCKRSMYFGWIVTYLCYFSRILNRLLSFDWDIMLDVIIRLHKEHDLDVFIDLLLPFLCESLAKNGKHPEEASIVLKKIIENLTLSHKQISSVIRYVYILVACLHCFCSLFYVVS